MRPERKRGAAQGKRVRLERIFNKGMLGREGLGTPQRRTADNEAMPQVAMSPTMPWALSVERAALFWVFPLAFAELEGLPEEVLLAVELAEPEPETDEGVAEEAGGARK